MTLKFITKKGDYFYFVFRVLVGLMFMQHGLQKVFGMLGGTPVQLFSLFGLAGFIELVGGAMIALGLLTRLAALFGVFDMAGAWVIAHLPQGVIPILNKGELALLYLASFLVILAYGSKRWGLDNLFCKER